MRYFRIVSLFAVVVLSGCASKGHLMESWYYYSTFETPTTLDIRKMSIRITESGWYRAPNVEHQHARFIWADSPSTTFDAYTRWALIPETTMNRRYSDLMPREQGEYFLAKRLMALLGSSGVLTDSSVETMDWAGRPGFRVTADFTTAQGLDMKLVAYGASYDRYLYFIYFESDAVENFDKVLPHFEVVAKAVTINTN